MTVEALMVDHYSQLRCSRLTILKTWVLKLMKVYHHALPFPNFMYLVQLEALVLGFGGFWTLLGINLSPRENPTHPCSHPCMSYLHLCSIMPFPHSHKDSLPFGMIRSLIDPPKGVWGSNLELTLVCIHMASKASWFFHIVLYTCSIHTYMLESHNNICYWLHVCM